MSGSSGGGGLNYAALGRGLFNMGSQQQGGRIAAAPLYQYQPQSWNAQPTASSEETWWDRVRRMFAAGSGDDNIGLSKEIAVDTPSGPQPIGAATQDAGSGMNWAALGAGLMQMGQQQPQRIAPAPMFSSPGQPWQQMGQPFQARLGGFPGSLGGMSMEEILRLLQGG